jgi:hypothetical protein
MVVQNWFTLSIGQKIIIRILFSAKYYRRKKERERGRDTEGKIRRK